MNFDDQPAARTDLALERKVSRSKWAIYFERLWPRVWLVLAVIAAFVFFSLSGLWTSLSPAIHGSVLTAFAIALAGAVVFALWVRWPSREAALARMERASGIRHRPASSYEDTLSSSDDPDTRTLWRAHRKRLAQLVDKLKVTRPRPNTDRVDPFALRAAMLLGLVVVFALASEPIYDRIVQAFEIHSRDPAVGVRLDAWVAPPAYTGQQPVMLTDGGQSTQQDDTKAKDGFFEVPANSVLIVRASGPTPVDVSLDVHEQGREPTRITADAAESPDGTSKGVSEVRHQLVHSARVELLVGKSKQQQWTFAVRPDALPKITLSHPPQVTPRGSMKLTYKATDDYGLASLAARVKKVDAQADDPTTRWARADTELKGPRLPPERPPQMALRLPRASAKDGEAYTNLEFASHPWAGLRVMMTLEATDVAGQIGRSEPFEIVLPQRRFRKPFARAIIEQRRKLVEDSRYRPHVQRALEALTLYPDKFIDDVQVYLGLRTAMHRLAQNDSRKEIKSVIDQLWHVAVRIEDGDLSDAERRLREAQEKLAKALEDGASDEEIQQAMDELRQALSDYLQQLQKQAAENPLQQQQPQGQDSQTLSQQDLDRMMQDLENQALNGSREQAQQMLSELRDLLDRIDKNQSSEMSEAQRQAQERAMQQMQELGAIVGQQQRLMDETFQRGQQQGQQQGEQQGRQQGQRGQQSPGQNGRSRMGEGQPGQGQSGQRGQGQQGGKRPPMAGQGGRPSPQDLQTRQRGLTQKLDDLQRELSRSGRDAAERLRGAREAMDKASEAIAEEQYREAARQQAQALEQMREAAQQMAEEMSQNQNQQAGQQGPNDAQRDPLGRPQRSSGPQLGTSVKVPDKIDMQRAREILQELRRRLGEPQRKMEELDYLERLLRRF